MITKARSKAIDIPQNKRGCYIVLLLNSVEVYRYTSEQIKKYILNA